MTETFDYVVVGAGSAGSVIAARLAEAGRTVCILEAGPSDRNPYIHIPAGYIKNIVNPALTWDFVSAPAPGLNGRTMALTQGRVVGGSSSINGMAYNRGQPADFDGWAQMGNPGWSYDDVLPFFRKSETRIGGDPTYRGTDGPLTVTDPGETGVLCDAFVQAAKSLGFPEVRDFNAAAQEGVGTWQYTMDRTRGITLRKSAARAFLKPAMKSGRITLRTESPATRLLFEGRKVVGVAYRAGKAGAPLREVRARREVIVSSGALNTPRLLQISGLGPWEHLRSLGVEVVRDMPGVGANLTDHYMLRVVGKVRGARTLNERSRGLALLWEGAKWAMGRSSILAMSPSLMRLFHRSDPQMETADLQLSFTPASYRLGFVGVLDEYPGMSLGGFPQRPHSRGHVRARSTDVDVPPEIQPNYLDTDYDRRCMIEIFRLARRLLATPAFAPYLVAETFPGPSVESDDEVLDFVRRYGGTVYHHTSTARMGPAEDTGAVVDHRLRVHGVDGLRVADASVMPAITSGNTNAPTIMIGEKAASMILEDEGRPVAAAGP